MEDGSRLLKVEEQLQVVSKDVSQTATYVAVMQSHMGDIKEIVAEMGHSLAEMVSLSNRVSKTEKDIDTLYTLTRSMEAEISHKAEKHTKACNDKTGTVEEILRDEISDAKKVLDGRMLWYLAGVLSLIGIVFYQGEKAHDVLRNVEKTVIENKAQILHNSNILKATHYEK